jgi:hypothetical protein
MTVSIDQAAARYIAVRENAIAEYERLVELARTRYRDTGDEREYERLRAQARNALAAEELAWHRFMSVKSRSDVVASVGALSTNRTVYQRRTRISARSESALDARVPGEES